MLMPTTPQQNLPQQDRDAEFLALLATFEPQLRACIHAMAPVWHDAEEILQKTRVTLWRGFADFRTGSNFLAWARTVARYEARAHRKKDRSRPRLFSEHVSAALLEQMAETPEEENRRWSAFVKCGQGLGVDARQILQGVYVDGQKIKEVAEKLGRTVSGTYMALSRIRRRLMECMEQRLREETR
jgi:RNA polymerase sigma-70 factor, ECF subfamily